MSITFVNPVDPNDGLDVRFPTNDGYAMVGLLLENGIMSQPGEPLAFPLTVTAGQVLQLASSLLRDVTYTTSRVVLRPSFSDRIVNLTVLASRDASIGYWQAKGYKLQVLALTVALNSDLKYSAVISVG